MNSASAIWQLPIVFWRRAAKTLKLRRPDDLGGRGWGYTKWIGSLFCTRSLCLCSAVPVWGGHETLQFKSNPMKIKSNQIKPNQTKPDQISSARLSSACDSPCRLLPLEVGAKPPSRWKMEVTEERWSAINGSISISGISRCVALGLVSTE
jgi:hypothetical protein